MFPECTTRPSTREYWDAMSKRRRDWNGVHFFTDVNEYRKQMSFELSVQSMVSSVESMVSSEERSTKNYLSYLRGEVAVRALPMEYEEDIDTLQSLYSKLYFKGEIQEQHFLNVAIQIENEIKIARPFPCVLCFLDTKGTPIANDIGAMGFAELTRHC